MEIKNEFGRIHVQDKVFYMELYPDTTKLSFQQHVHPISRPIEFINGMNLYYVNGDVFFSSDSSMVLKNVPLESWVRFQTEFNKNFGLRI